jgi:ribonuclease BN (tRNA processing enzyme)
MDGLLLGSGGWIPTSRRETCAALLREDTHILLIDAGTGIQRLVEHPNLLAGVETVDVVLTHFHLDHVVGLSYLPALPLPEPPTIWGAGKLLAGVGTRSILDRLLDPPLFSAPLSSIAAAVREIPSEGVEIDSFALSTRVQKRHTEPTLALRIGDSLTYCTDTASDPENAEFATGSSVLLHEAWYAQDSNDDASHTAAGDAARIAREACVERLVLIHINPLREEDEALAQTAMKEFPAVEVGRDLAPIRLD